jgi:hypothetical protein
MRTGRPWAILALAALGIAAPAPLRGQATVSVQLLYPIETVFAGDLSPYNIGQQPDFLLITVLNGAVGSQQVRLRLTIRREQPTAAVLFTGTTGLFTVGGPVRRITNRELADEDSDVVIEDFELADEGEALRQIVLETGQLPSGTYVFDVQLLSAAGGQQSSFQLPLTLTNPTRIELISPGRPFGDIPEVVTGTPRFQWTTDGGPAPAARYRLRVVPASASSSAEEAMQGFASWETETNASTALYPGEVTAIPLQPGGTYAWQVVRLVSTSGGDVSIASPIYWFRMGGGAGNQGNNGNGNGQSEQAATVRQLNALSVGLGLGTLLDGFRPTGQLVVDGKPVSAEGLEALLAAILSGQINVHNITVR